MGPRAVVTSASFESREMTRRQIRRGLIASFLGSVVMWYDILIFGLLVPGYLGPLFFPSKDPLVSAFWGYVALLASFGARPVGGIVFGHIGDRVGRKAALLTTLLLGGLASAGIGLLPTYVVIGVLAPVFLFAVRALVGLAVGGEWGGATTLLIEWGNKTGRRGYLTAWPQVSVGAALLLCFGAIAASMALVGPHSYWTWRLPFLASLAITGIGAYVRLGILETPIFSGLRERRRIARHPVTTALRRNFKEVALSALLRQGEQLPSVIYSNFFIAYGGLVLKLPYRTLVFVSVVAGLASLFFPIIWGRLSDRFGRRRIFILGVIATAVMAPFYFPLLDTGDLNIIIATQAVAQVVNAMTTGPISAYITEQFPARVRYSGASVAEGVGAVLSGGIASPITTQLLIHFGAASIALYIIAGCVISLLAALGLRDRRKQDLAVEYPDNETERAMAEAPA